jgi:hypothetical protein
LAQNGFGVPLLQVHKRLSAQYLIFVVEYTNISGLHPPTVKQYTPVGSTKNYVQASQKSKVGLAMYYAILAQDITQVYVALLVNPLSQLPAFGLATHIVDAL